MLKIFNQKLQETENMKRDLEREVDELKKQLGLKKNKGRQKIF